MSLWVVVLAGAAAAAGTVAFAQEHPKEHPGAKKEPKPAAKEPVSKEEIGSAIRSWVARDTKLKGGYFLVWDETAKKPLALTLATVHDDKLAKVADGTWFACADFKSADGTVYDLDVFLKGSSAKKLEASELTIHKENGKERYGWNEEGGVWKKTQAK